MECDLPLSVKLIVSLASLAVTAVCGLILWLAYKMAD